MHPYVVCLLIKENLEGFSYQSCASTMRQKASTQVLFFLICKNEVFQLVSTLYHYCYVTYCYRLFLLWTTHYCFTNLLLFYYYWCAFLCY
jgi:hypothetical protein